MLVLDRQTGNITHAHFRQIGDYLNAGDLMVINQTRVIPARLYARKVSTGGKVELLLLNRRDTHTWEVLVGGKGITTGKLIALEGGPRAEIQEDLGSSRRLVRFEEPIGPFLDKIGHTPLPPYIHEMLKDPERYQTVYAREPGSAAAPTAGLHFTPALIDHLKGKGIGFAKVTLHVGLDTFAPVTEEVVSKHQIHTEWCQLSLEAVQKIIATRQEGRRIVAVGTTSVRVLETAAQKAQGGDVVGPVEGPTDLYILPGYRFRIADALVTNFHLPRSTLIMLVSAFAGREKTLYAYEIAIREKYRFYSFGDAMLIL
jgi:S-adenosylmethionine:tRNA ribosyltransferase-isomerase